MTHRVECPTILAVRLMRSTAWDTFGHFLETVPMVVTFLGAFAAYLSLLTGVGLVSNGLTVVALHWTGPKFIDGLPIEGTFRSLQVPSR